MFHFIEETLRLFVDVLTGFGTDLGRNQNKGYNAAFIRERDVLSARNTGFSMTGARNLSNKQSYQNALVCGSTGTGKSASILIPTAFTAKNASLIFNDPSGELLAKTGGYLKRSGYDIKVLNFAKPAHSSGYNPLFRANTASDIQKVAAMLVEHGSGGGKGDQFWNTMAVNLITMLIGILQTQDVQYRTLYNVRQLLNALGGNPKGVESLYATHASDQLYAEYTSFLSLDEKIQTSSIATAKATLQLFNDEGVARATSFDSLELSDLRKKPIALFVQTAIGDAKYYAALVSIFFQQCINDTLARFPETHERDIFFLLDEASSLKIPVLPLAVANVRKHRAGIMLLVQSEQQLQNNYGKPDADAIMANCFAKLYMTGQDLETCKKLESLLGKIEYKDETQKKNIMPLMTADAIRTMKLSQALLLCGHHKPIRATLYPYYENATYRTYSSIPAPIHTTHTTHDAIPVLPLATPDDDDD